MSAASALTIFVVVVAIYFGFASNTYDPPEDD